MINVRELTYTYPKTRQPAVKSVSFEIEKGEIFGFLGPSGAGKSTMQKVMIGLLKGYGGSILLQNRELSDWKSDLYYQIGVGFELPNHYPKLSALENLRFFASFYNTPTQSPMELLAWVGLEQDAQKRVEDFSKGMKMRLNFVRALLHRPPILFLDEPTSGLDPVNGKVIKDIILKLKSEGTTVILTTHHMNDAEQLCDRLAFIVDGEIALVEAPSALKRQYGKRSVILEYVETGQQTAQKASFELDDIGHDERFLSLLQTQHIQSIHSQEASLEDIFIQVTGKTLLSTV